MKLIILTLSDRLFTDSIPLYHLSLRIGSNMSGGQIRQKIYLYFKQYFSCNHAAVYIHIFH